MKYFLILLIIHACLESLAQKTGNAHYHQQAATPMRALRTEVKQDQIHLSITGLLNAQADYYVAIFSVAQVGETAEKTDSLLSRRVEKFTNAVKQAGLDSVRIISDMIAFVPKYDLKVFEKLFSKTYNEIPDGFELQKNIIVSYRHGAYLDHIVRAAATAEIYDLAKVDYFINDVEKQYQKLRLRCLQSLKEKMKSYEIIGVNLEKAKRSISEDYTTVLPHQRYSQYTAIARPSLKAMKKNATVSDKISTIETSPSRYYEALPFDQFDVVMNPVVHQPMVQFTYRINIQFVVNEVEPKATNTNVLFITPNGQLQNIDLTKAVSPER